MYKRTLQYYYNVTNILQSYSKVGVMHFLYLNIYLVFTFFAFIVLYIKTVINITNNIIESTPRNSKIHKH